MVNGTWSSLMFKWSSQVAIWKVGGLVSESMGMMKWSSRVRCPLSVWNDQMCGGGCELMGW
eukprot:988649-Alexandrium_andersonii.AAC.1